MDHETAGEELRQAESRVARADRRVTNQRRLVARLEREGRATRDERAEPDHALGLARDIGPIRD